MQAWDVRRGGGLGGWNQAMAAPIQNELRITVRNEGGENGAGKQHCRC